jgi:hypothetical protein
MQFMHVGRIAHSANRYVGDPPVAPSVVRAAGQMWTDALGMQDLDTPRALDTNEIPGVIAQYGQATTNALAADFDGVELHSASGYLPMQFLSTGSNRRTDGYGGSVHNRIRFVVEALEAMAAAAGGASRVGIKISPAMPFNDIQDDDPVETYTTLVKAIAPRLAYLHVLRTPPLPNIFEILRPLFFRPVCRRRGVRPAVRQCDAGIGWRRLHRFRQAVHLESRSAGAIRGGSAANFIRCVHLLYPWSEGIHRFPCDERLGIVGLT